MGCLGPYRVKFRDKKQLKWCIDMKKGKPFTSHVGLDYITSFYVYTVSKRFQNEVIIGLHLNSLVRLNDHHIYINILANQR